ncbi:MAG: hypothetical protein ACJAWS_002848 [Oleiphilaceae bacterium]|jgi:hypothetical protein
MNTLLSFTSKLFAIAVIFTALTSSLFAGEVYKWTDSNGMIHYSDIKPRNVSSKNIKVKAGKSSNTRTSFQEQAQILDKTRSQQLASQAQNLQDDTYKRENDARCQTLRDNLIKFQENNRIKINEDGIVRFLTPEEISAKTKQYNQTLKDSCS